MPLLPSGLKLALTIDHIMEPDRNWFKSPPGHFWYWTPTEKNIPPFSLDQKLESMPKTAPIPSSREAMECFVRVCIRLENELMYWRGEMLSEFPKYGTLSDEDNKAWREWVNSDKVRAFLDSAIIKCQTQAEINKEAVGYAVFRGKENDDGVVVGEKIIDNPIKDAN